MGAQGCDREDMVSPRLESKAVRLSCFRGARSVVPRIVNKARAGESFPGRCAVERSNEPRPQVVRERPLERAAQKSGPGL